MLMSVCFSHAQQKIVGDMNDDGVLNIADLTLFVNTLLGKTAQKVVSGGGSDQTTLMGSWAATDGTNISVLSNGVARVNGNNATYEYYPSKGGLMFYNSSNSLIAAYKVQSVSLNDHFVVYEAKGTSPIYYYAKSKFATSISMTETSANMFLGSSKSLYLTATPSDALMYNATWKSSDASVATVSSSGFVTAKGVGTATITATAADGNTATCKVTVLKPVENVTFPYSKLNIPVGATYTLTPTVTPFDASRQTLSWTSNKPAITSVSNGVVTTKAAGSTIIIATTTDGTNLKAACTIQSINATPTDLTISKTSATLAPSATLQLSATITPSTAASLSVVWSSSNTDIATVDQKGLVTVKPNLIYGKATIYAQIAGTSIKKSCTVTVDDPSLYVDLDLPSGTLWATMNVGAKSPEDYGNYYAWGETKAYGEEDKSNTHNYSYNGSYTKAKYIWDTYKWSNGTNYKTLTKYNTNSSYGTVDNVKTLYLADDAAYVNWGAKWRMPNSDEIKELINYCVWTWTVVNGTRGYKVSSKKNVLKYIFLPASGCRAGGSLYYDVTNGYYWSSSIESSDYPYNAFLISMSQSGASCEGYARSTGYPIRPVRR